MPGFAYGAVLEGAFAELNVYRREAETPRETLEKAMTVRAGTEPTESGAEIAESAEALFSLRLGGNDSAQAGRTAC